MLFQILSARKNTSPQHPRLDTEAADGVCRVWRRPGVRPRFIINPYPVHTSTQSTCAPATPPVEAPAGSLRSYSTDISACRLAHLKKTPSGETRLKELVLETRSVFIVTVSDNEDDRRMRQQMIEHAMVQHASMSVCFVTSECWRTQRNPGKNPTSVHEIHWWARFKSGPM